MSYEICYRAMGIKMSDGTVVPMDESGSNNCYEPTAKGMRRERNWSNGWAWWRHKLSYTEQEMRDVLTQVVEDDVKRWVGKPEPFNEEHHYTEDEILKNFSYFSCIKIGNGTGWSSATSFVNFFMKCFTQAVDWEFLKHNYIGVYVTWYEKDEGEDESTLHRVKVANEDELIKAYNAHKGAIVRFDSVGEYAYNDVKPKRKEPKPLTNGWVLKINGDRYVSSVTSRRLRHSSYLSMAHVYSSNKSALAASEKIMKRFSSVGHVSFREVEIGNGEIRIKN